MSNPRNFARITMLLFSLVTNFGPEFNDDDSAFGVSRALAAEPVSHNVDLLFPHYGILQVNRSYNDGISILAESTGTINLTWTAPGDDGDSGRADHYVIKFSSDPINDGNWNQALNAPSPPAPLDAGTSQAYELAGLEPGQIYYIAIKTYDDAGNSSLISNIASGYSSGITAPILVGASIDTVARSANLVALPVEAPMAVFYEFALDSLPNFDDPLIDIDLIVDSVVSVTFTQLRIDVVYFWRCRVIASDRSDSSSWSVVDSFLIYTPDLVAPTVAVSSPNGGEVFESGMPDEVRWYCSDNIGINSCRVEYSSDNGSNWTILRDWAGVHDSIPWIAPAQPSTHGRIRVSARDFAGNIGTDISDNVFTVDDNIPPIVAINNPVVDDSVTLGWYASDNGAIAHYLIDYTVDGGQNWIEVSSGLGGDSGSVTLPIPGQIPALGIRVTCFDLAENAGADTLIVTPTSADDPDGTIPSGYYLAQSYPNPFNPSATIEYGLPAASHVNIEVFDITGARVMVLKDDYQEAGGHSVIWNAGDVTSGTYFYRIVAGEFSEVGKATLLK